MGDSTPKNEEIHPQAECSSNRSEQLFQILTSNLNNAETRAVRVGLVK
jgi:hypothetical protein